MENLPKDDEWQNISTVTERYSSKKATKAKIVERDYEEYYKTGVNYLIQDWNDPLSAILA